MVSTENDFLGILMKVKDDKNNCSIMEVVEKSKFSDLDCLSFINSLESKGIVKMLDFSTIHINPSAFELYQSPKKKVAKSFFKLSVSFLKFLVTYILGIISGLIIAYLTNKFGW